MLCIGTELDENASNGVLKLASNCIGSYCISGLGVVDWSLLGL